MITTMTKYNELRDERRHLRKSVGQACRKIDGCNAHGLLLQFAASHEPRGTQADEE